MDWSNERYVRLYTRNTDDWMVWPWQARALFPLLMRAADRAGHIDTSRGFIGIAALVMLPLEVVEVGMQALLEGHGAPVAVVDRGYLIRNFLDAQEANQTDQQRARESRARKRDRLRHGVTTCDASVTNVAPASRDVTQPSHVVTRGHPSLPSLAVPSQTQAQTAAQASLDLGKREVALAWELWLRHCDKHDALRAQRGIEQPKLLRLDTSPGFRDLLDRVKSYKGDLETAEAQCMLVLLYRESEARGGRLDLFGNGIWREQMFSFALDKSAETPVASKQQAVEWEFKDPWSVQ